MHKKCLNILLISILTLSLNACSERFDKRGKPLVPSDLNQIKISRHTKADVQNILGSPTLIDKFNPNTWFYLYRLTSTTAFFEPEEKRMKIVAVKFDKSGIVREIRKFGEQGTRNVNIVPRKTPTRGRNAGYLEQIFGNFGRIHKGNTPLE